MAKRPILAWYPTRACWKKQINGKVFYFGTGGCCKNKEDQTGYEIALGEYLTLKRRLSVDSPKAGEPVDPVAATLAADFPSPAGLQNVAAFAMDYSEVTKTPEAESAKSGRPPTLKKLINLYTDEYKLRIGQDVGIAAWKGQCQALADVLTYAERVKLTKLSDFDTVLLRGYTKIQRKWMQEGKKGCSPSTVRKRLHICKVLAEWAYDNEYIDAMPRCLNRKYAAVTVPTTKPTMLTREQVDALWLRVKGQAGNGKGGYRNALLFLLGLNCGYRSGDISSLTWSMIVERGGETFIERKRPKTKQISFHKLWPITVQLLKLAGTVPKKSENVILDNHGGLLVKESEAKRTDQCNAYWKNLNMPFQCLHSYLRKTSADYLAETFPQYADVVSLFLAHKVVGVKYHYINGHHDILHSCTDTMDEFYGFTL